MKVKFNYQVFIADILIPAILLMISTAIFRIYHLDLTIQSWFYRVSEGWYLKNQEPWNTIYHFGNFPALVLAFAAIILFAAGFRHIRLIKFRKISLFLLILLLTGPGLLVNTALKDNWGRPRPRNIVEFNGKYQFEPVLTIDRQSDGKSFPCGHATMGFYFFALFFILRKQKKILAWSIFGFSLIFGFLIGLTRIIQGGHFATDVIWSAGLIYISGAIIFHLMKMDRSIFFTPVKSTQSKKLKNLWIDMIVLILIIALLAGILVATPFEKEKTYRDTIPTEIPACQLNFELISSDVKLIISDQLEIRQTASGFGFPNSNILSDWKREITDSLYRADFQQYVGGYFTELHQELTIYLPALSGRYSFSADYLDLQMIIPDSLNLLITLPVNITVDNRSEKLTKKESGIYQLGSDHNLQIELNQETGSVSFSDPEISD